MKKYDIYLVFFVIILIITFFVFNIFNVKKGDTVLIYLNGEEFKCVSLDEEQEINVNDTNTICVEKGKVFMKSANCPDQICVHQAPLDSADRDIVCLPNRVTVRVVTNNKKEADAVVK